MNYCFLDAKTFYQFQELKKEGEDCGFPPHGSIFIFYFNDNYIKNELLIVQFRKER